MKDIIFKFAGKKIGHKLSPGTYTARMLRTRINQAGNLEITLANVTESEKPIDDFVALQRVIE